MKPRAEGSEGLKAKAATMLGQGYGTRETAEACEIHRVTLWEWRKDPEFRAIMDRVIEAGVEAAAKAMRDLAQDAVETFRKSLESTDEQVALKAADLVTRRIAELVPQSNVDLNLNASELLADMIRELDADSGAARASEGPPPPPPP